jgi:uncharacterized delta-60 repeat protein
MSRALALAALALTAALIAPASAGAVLAGAIDSRFASCGQATALVPNSIAGRQFDYRAGSSLVVLPDGKVVAAGPAARGMGATRFLPDGRLDTSFGGDGVAFIPTAGQSFEQSFVNAVAVQPDGKVIAAGWRQTPSTSSSGMRPLIARFTASGEPDTSFGGDGLVDELPPGTAAFGVDGVALASDGSLIAAGNADNRFGVVRLRPDGSFEPAFGEGGVARVTTPGRPNGWGSGVFVRPDGRIVTAGYTYENVARGAFTVARLTAGGAPDPTFAGGGAVAEQFDEHSLASTLVPLPDGRFYAIGTTEDRWGDEDYPSTTRRAAVVRYLEDGARDTSFAGDGTVLDALGEGLHADVGARGGAVDTDGRLTIATSRTRLARYTAAGARDSAFGLDGVLRLFGAPTGDSLVALPDGGLLLGGANLRQGSRPRGFSFGPAIMRLAGSGAALAAVEDQPAACSLRLRNPTITHMLRRGSVARNGRVLVGFYLTQPGRGSVSALLETGEDITIGEASFNSSSAGSSSIELRVRAAAAQRLRRLRSARIRVFLTLEEGGVVQPVTVAKTLRR